MFLLPSESPLQTRGITGEAALADHFAAFINEASNEIKGTRAWVGLLHTP